MNLLEKIAPGWAYKREVDKHNLSVVRSMSSAWRRTGYSDGMGGRSQVNAMVSAESEDKVASWTYDNMIANAMQLYRDDPLTKSIVNASVTYMGESVPHATTSDKEWNKLATAWFNEIWWKYADARRRPGVDFGELQNLFERWQWIGGDMIMLPYDGALIPYEGLQIRTPSELQRDKSILNGVRVMQREPYAITHYYIVSRDEKGNQTFNRVRSNECFFMGSRNWRPAMLRSVPDLHGVIDALHKFNGTNDNVQRRIEFESMLWTVERKGAVGSLPGSRMLAAGSGGDMQVESSKVDYGMRMKVNGDVNDFKLTQMQNPQSNYTNVMEFMARAISAGTGFPYEIVMHIYTSGSYTANRAARLDFAKSIMNRWAWRNKVMNQRCWNWAVAKAIKSGELPEAPRNPVTGLSEWNSCAWTLPHFPHIDEGKEVLADINQWGCGQESIEDWARQKGMTRDQMLDAHDEDIEQIKRRADKLDIPLEIYMGKLFTASAVKVSQPQPQQPEDE
jgi:hypothetical protein